MAVAKARSFNDLSLKDAAKSSRIAKGYVVQANVVLHYAPDLADAVLAGRQDELRLSI